MDGSSAVTIAQYGRIDSFQDFPLSEEQHFKRTKNKSIMGYEQYFVVHSVNNESPKMSWLHFFDWEGNPLCEISVEPDFSMFGIDTAQNYLYTYNCDSECFMRYKLPTIMQK